MEFFISNLRFQKFYRFYISVTLPPEPCSLALIVILVVFLADAPYLPCSVTTVLLFIVCAEYLPCSNRVSPSLFAENVSPNNTIPCPIPISFSFTSNDTTISLLFTLSTFISSSEVSTPTPTPMALATFGEVGSIAVVDVKSTVSPRTPLTSSPLNIVSLKS
ncbi:hypothetical protein AX774_g7968 [Zancudomyces culisetae]|uniref:Uncharacterized protein n=1 Tax=Zancudomyces culisetae TaxID=1213189 RepID=A0A1R1PCD7_ZANCU|nr:hypothetical protein AX774_g7968 [Zancudomyces culisetae]|eukprot:OMH78636.1 hypothetical protein AX774_g7968 [Zancudomyces culisetae]